MDVALVGIGRIAEAQHIPAILASECWRLGATVSRQGTVEGIASYTDIDLMLKAHPEIRVVSLCLPPAPRFEYAVKAIQAGRHVMLEKPPGATLSECHILTDLAKQAGVSLFATWHSREARMVQRAKTWLRGKTLRRVHIEWREDVRLWHPGQDWIFEPGGMGVFDPGINAMSIVTELLPDRVYIKKSDLYIPENAQTPIAAKLVFYHPKGAEFTAEFDFLKTGRQIWTVHLDCEEGSAALSEGGDMLSINGQDVTELQASDKVHGEYVRLYDKMADLVAAGGIDMDLSPLRHVSDAFSLGHRHVAAPFEW